MWSIEGTLDEDGNPPKPFWCSTHQHAWDPEDSGGKRGWDAVGDYCPASGVNSKKLLNKEYDSQSLCDVKRDVYEALSECDLPVDEHGCSPGTFRVEITWTDSGDDDGCEYCDMMEGKD